MAARAACFADAMNNAVFDVDCSDANENGAVRKSLADADAAYGGPRARFGGRSDGGDDRNYGARRIA